MLKLQINCQIFYETQIVLWKLVAAFSLVTYWKCNNPYWRCTVGLPQFQFWEPEPRKMNKSSPNRIEKDFFKPILKWDCLEPLACKVGCLTEIVVLRFNVGPKAFGNLSDICQKSVRKLSVIKMCQITVINVSEFCQKTVRCKYLSEIYQKRFRNLSEMCQIL